MLGLDRRNSMFAALYLTRSDTNLTVNHVAFQVWKSLIPNTPKVRVGGPDFRAPAAASCWLRWAGSLGCRRLHSQRTCHMNPR